MVTNHPRYSNKSWMNFRYEFSNFSINCCGVSISGHLFQHTHVGRCRIPSSLLTILTCGQVPRSLRPYDHYYLLYLHDVIFGFPWPGSWASVTPINWYRNLLNAAPWVSFVIKYPIMSALGNHSRESSYFSIWFVKK